MSQADGRAVIGTSDEDLGRLVRETWVEWARKQPGAKPSWLVGWDEELDAGQREVDILIGRAVLARANASALHPGGGAHVCSCGRQVQ